MQNPPSAKPGARIQKICEIWAAALPEPRTELTYETPFELLVAVMLSAQATDRSVNQATAQLFPVANTPEGLCALGAAGLLPYVRHIGLHQTKIRHLLATSTRVIAEHGGAVPNTRAALEALPGVGRKTANVILNTLYGVPTLAVDTHVFRVARRMGLSTQKTPLGVERDLLAQIPDRYLQNAHHWMVLHGRYCCTARKPACTTCPVATLCPAIGVPGRGDRQQ